MIFGVFALFWVIHPTNPIYTAPDIGSPVNSSLQQSCPPGTFLFGSLQDKVLDFIRVTSSDGLSTKCSKILINCSLRTMAISMLNCCPGPVKGLSLHGYVHWIPEHLEVVNEKDVFYLQGCLEHLNGIAIRGRLVILKEHYRQVQTKECKTIFEYSVERKVQYLTMQFVAMLFILGSVSVCCASLMIYDGVHYGLEQNAALPH